jgi:hypothetical protein
MRPIKLHFTLIVLAIVAILNGCVSSNRGTPSPIPMTPTTGMSPTATPLSYTPTITQTLTFTPVATLFFDEAYNHLGAYLDGTLGCRLPCWLGITPGNSTRQDVNELLTMFRSIATDSVYGYPADLLLMADSSVAVPALFRRRRR